MSIRVVLFLGDQNRIDKVKVQSCKGTKAEKRHRRQQHHRAAMAAIIGGAVAAACLLASARRLFSLSLES